MDIRPFHVDHLKGMQLQPSQADRAHLLTPEHLEFLAGLDAYTVFAGGRPVASCGLFDIWPGRAMAWAFIAADAGRHLLGITRAVQRYLDLKAPRRCELYVDLGFEPGYRWAEMLGFEREGVLRAFEVDGRDQVLFARIRQ
jgi:RimJ/RimL family protein N-acetyltransferase